MARFDVYELKGRPGLVIDCQADILSGFNTRFVLPLLPLDEAPRPATRLNPVFDYRGNPFVLVTQHAAALGVAELGPMVGTLRAHDVAIRGALDMLLNGL